MANLSTRNWKRLKELVLLLIQSTDSKEQAEILDTITEVIFPEENIGGIEKLDVGESEDALLIDFVDESQTPE